MKKAIIFDPYLDTLGGGERYALTFALGLKNEGYQVEIAWPDKETIEKAQERFGLDLSSLKLNKKAYQLFTQKTGFFKKLFFTLRYRLIFWVSDGSLPLLFGRKNLIHFQVPFTKIGGSAFSNKIKILFIHKFVYNSRFTMSVHERHFPKNKSFILYPPIDTQGFTSGKKEDIILSVARFDSPSHSKRQDILIEAFKKLNKKFPSYQLFLVGGSRGDSNTLEKLKTQAGNLPVKFIVNPDFDKLKQLYSKAKFFWHAAGYKIDETTDPEKVEHFGMTTVEAMAAGCVPVVIAKGGQKEIIKPGTGFLCNSPEEMAKETGGLIKNQLELNKITSASQKRSLDFSTGEFNQKLRSLTQLTA